MMIRIFKHFVPLQILALVLADAVILFGAMYLGIAFRFIVGDTGGLHEILPIYPKAIVFTLAMLGTMTAFGLYMRDVVRGDWGYYLRFLGSFATGTIVMTMTFYMVPGIFLGRGAFALTVLTAMLGAVIARGTFLRIVNHDVLKKRLLVLGSGTRAAKVEEILREHDLGHKFYLVGFVPLDNKQHSVNKDKIINDSRHLLATAIHYEVDEIIVGVRDRRGGALSMEELLECKLEGINVVDLSSFFERETGHVQLDSLNPSWMVFSDGFCRSSTRNVMKRAFDIAASTLLLVVTLPVMAITALLIYLETGRPILYRQARIGECGHVFEVLKFRSMCVDAERAGAPQWAKVGDSRITRVGNVIRKLRIDELPQIFNVLKGDMSFVGPRPERPFFVNELAKQIPFYASRHSVKPGITGWAQINYPYGASVEDAKHKLQYDLYYAKNHSLFLDVVILFQTAQVVLFGKGAR
jgi:sugar transferase (PEP-CTERM system associated)